VALARRPTKPARTNPRRFKTLVEWDSRTDWWFASVPVLGLLSISATAGMKQSEFVKKAIHSYVDRAAAGGPRIPPENYEEVLEVEVEVPLKGVLT